jgi:hypothetical protein
LRETIVTQQVNCISNRKKLCPHMGSFIFLLDHAHVLFLSLLSLSRPPTQKPSLSPEDKFPASEFPWDVRPLNSPGMSALVCAVHAYPREFKGTLVFIFKNPPRDSRPKILYFRYKFKFAEIFKFEGSAYYPSTWKESFFLSC